VDKDSHKVEANPSTADWLPGWWGWDTENYDDPRLKPTGKVTHDTLTKPHDAQVIAEFKSQSSGMNHAFPLSAPFQKAIGWSPVPSLDTQATYWIRVDRIHQCMDVILIVHADAYPNCEAFIVDQKKKRVFLGTHVRLSGPVAALSEGAHHRIAFANALRIELDEDGNFGERLWVFAHVLGGPPSEREWYAMRAIDEHCL
jgi:hypothetical protein